jgi:hypothetical protein
MNIKQFAFMMFMIVLVILVALFGLYLTDNVKTTSESVPCYDRYSNEIQGMTCTSEMVHYPDLELSVFVGLLLALLSSLVFLPIIISALGDER